MPIFYNPSPWTRQQQRIIQLAKRTSNPTKRNALLRAVKKR